MKNITYKNIIRLGFLLDAYGKIRNMIPDAEQQLFFYGPVYANRELAGQELAESLDSGHIRTIRR